MFSEFNWIQALQQSPIMMALGLFSVLVFGVAAERLLYYRRRTGNADALLDQLLPRIRSGHVNEALKVARENEHPLGAVADRLMKDLRAGDCDPEESLHVGLSEQKLLLEKNLGILGSMAAVAPLVGLLGTVWGIMRAFHDMSATGSAAPTVVASGVAEALLTTAAGLVIAVPSVLLFNHFTRRMTVMLTIAENHSRRLRQVWNASSAGKNGDNSSSDDSTIEDLARTAETVADTAR